VIVVAYAERHEERHFNDASREPPRSRFGRDCDARRGDASLPSVNDASHSSEVLSRSLVCRRESGRLPSPSNGPNAEQRASSSFLAVFVAEVRKKGHQPPPGVIMMPF
jgi:hypothetical protein